VSICFSRIRKTFKAMSEGNAPNVGDTLTNNNTHAIVQNEVSKEYESEDEGDDDESSGSSSSSGGYGGKESSRQGGASIVSSLIGTRFTYMERVAKTFINKVAISPQEHSSSDGDEDENVSNSIGDDGNNSTVDENPIFSSTSNGDTSSTVYGDALQDMPFLDMSRSGGDSLAVNFATLEDDTREDAAMDGIYFGDSTVGGGETSIAGGGSTIGLSTLHDGWGDEDLASIPDEDAEDEKVGNSEELEGSMKTGKKTTTFSLRLNTFQTHVVDHTPSELSQQVVSSQLVNPSIAVLAASVDLSEDTDNDDEDGDIYRDENELSFGQVVDHTPVSTTPINIMHSTANSLSVMASVVKDESLADDDVLDLTSYEGDSSLGRIHDMQDSETMSKVVELGSRKAAGQVDDINPSVTLVDQTPSDMVSPSNETKDPSLEVLPSEINTRATGDADSTGENILYGPMVDHTPSTPAHSLVPIRSDSVIVQAQDLDTVDETTVVGGSRYEDDDGEYGDDEDLAGDLPSDGAKLVDYVPPRSESRFGDASTVVAADPSEVISEEDDLAPEEQNFGPVVDLTPPVHPSVAPAEVPSGAGSTVVFVSPSVADDLDEEDPATESQGEQLDEWQGNPSVEDNPNPQSGNDEPTTPQIDEQLVDFLPPVLETVSNDAEDVAREGFSEMTVGGAQSLLQTGDPIEDDFGPVVDLTPFLSPSIQPIIRAQAITDVKTIESDGNSSGRDVDDNSVATDVREHLKSKVVVDPLPRLISNKPIDSNATAGGSQSSEEEEDDASNKFGPVVDHLPTSRSSLAPSRGGSTVDALANVSEANSDDDDGEEGVGWDDVDFDASLGGVSEGTGRQTLGSARKLLRQSIGLNDNDRNVSVRFDASVNDSKSSESLICGVPHFHRAHLYDEPFIGTTELKDSHFELPEDMDAWDDDIDEDGVGVGNNVKGNWDHKRLIDKSFSEADTPPSTPYRRSEAEIVNLCPSNRFTIPLPMIESNKSWNATSAPVRHMADGDFGVDGGTKMIQPLEKFEEDEYHFMKVLEDEKAKRSELENRLSIIQSTLKGADVLQDSSTKDHEYELQVELSKLVQTRDILTQQINSSQVENELLRQQADLLRKDSLEYCKSISELEKLVGETKLRALDHEGTIKSLYTTLKESDAAAEMERVELQRKVTCLQHEVDTYADQSARRENEFSTLELDKQSLMRRTLAAEEESSTLKQKLLSLEQEMKIDEGCFKTQGQKVVIDGNAIGEKYKKLVEVVDQLHSQLSNLDKQHGTELRRQEILLENECSETLRLESLLRKVEEEKKSLISVLENQISSGRRSEAELVSIVQELDQAKFNLQESQQSLITANNTIKNIQEKIVEQESNYLIVCKKLNQEIKNLKAAMEEKERENKGFAVKVTSGAKELATHKNRLRRAVVALVNYQSSSEAREATLEQIEENISNLDQSNDAWWNRLTTNTENIQNLKKENGELKREVDELKSRSLTFKEDFERLESQIRNDEAKNNTLMKELEASIRAEEERWSAKYSDLQLKFAKESGSSDESLMSLRNKIDNLEKVASEHERRRKESEKEASAVAALLKIEQSQLSEVKTERDRLKAEVEDLLIEFGLFKQKIDEYNVNDVSECLQSKIYDLEKEKAVLFELYNELQVGNSKLQEDLNLVTSENAGIGAQLLVLEGECASMKAVKGEKEMLDVIVGDNENTINELNEMSTALRENISRQDALLTTKTNEIATIMEKRKVREADVAVLESEIVTCKKQIQELELKECIMLKQLEEHQTKDSSISNLQARFREKEEMASMLQHEVTLLKEACDTLQNRLTYATQDLEKVSAGDVKWSMESARISKLVEDLESQLQEKNDLIVNMNLEIISLKAHLQDNSTKAKSEIIKSLTVFKNETETLKSSLRATGEILRAREHDVDRLNMELLTARSEKMENFLKSIKSNPATPSDCSRSPEIRTENQRVEAISRIQERAKATRENLQLLAQSIQRLQA
jgi:chromosome segregation ATPase